MGDRYMLGFMPALRFLRSKFCADSTKAPKEHTRAHVKDPVAHVRVRRIMKTTHNNPAGPESKSVSLCQIVGHHTEEEWVQRSIDRCVD